MVKPNPSEYLLFLLLSLAVLLAPCDAAAAGQSPRKVLLLTSYHQGDRWNDSVVQGVREALGSLESLGLSIENLDMRRHVDPDYARRTTEYIRAKYRGRPQDLVLISDDPALNFLLAVRDDLFPTAPVVFCGVNNFTPKRIQGYANITGVNEALSLEATLELALKLFPRTTRIMAMVSDMEVSARTNLEHFRAVATRMRGRVQFDELLNMTDLDAPDILGRLPKDSLILRLTTLLTQEGGFLSIEDGSRILSAYSPVPVFTAWSFDLGDCALGGYVSSGQDQGRAAGNLAIRILEGQGADQIPVVMESPNVPMFDYKVMKRFGIKESDLPKGSVVLNRQVSMWEQYWVWLLGIALFCGLQMFLILALLASDKRLRAANFALCESEERYRSVVENISDVYYRTDVEGRLVMFSPSAMRLLGYGSLDEMLGRKAASFYADPAKREQLLERLRVEGSVNDYELTLRRRDGSELQVATSSSYYRDAAGAVLGVEGIFRDITERKRAEEEKEKLQAQLLQAQKMESVGRLAGGVAHDFNNMLGVILGYAAMALGELPVESRVRECLLEVQKAAERSATLTGQLLAFARKQTVAPKMLDLNETVEGMLRMLRRLIGEDIDLAWLPGSNLDPVFIDPSQVDQILSNLCVNARDAIADTGKITIGTGSVSFDEAYCADHAGFLPGEFAMLAVSDDGCGMSPETLANIFEPFFTTKELGKGTGLGLATVYGIVKQNNGFMNVYSEPGQGTTFKIYLPRHAATAAPRPEQEQTTATAKGGETILLVEDEPAILKLTTMILERMGYVVITAETPNEAIRLAREHQGRIDLLLTDVVMPEMNGRDLARNLMSLYPEIKRLFMSGYTANVIAHHGVLDEGMHFIQKPFSRKDLTAKILEALDRD